MGKNKLAAIIVGCTIVIIVVIALIISHPWRPPISPLLYSLSVDVSPSGAGSVSLAPSGGTYGPGVQVTLTASPARGYHFVSWSGDISGTNLTTTIAMDDSNKNVIATFERFEQRLSRVSNVILSNGSYTTLPSNGIYLQAGQLVTLSWSADGHLDIYLFTETQFDNFKPYLIPSVYENHFSGKGATFSTYITNNDTYYVVIAHLPLSSQSTIKLYQATLTSQ